MATSANTTRRAALKLGGGALAYGAGAAAFAVATTATSSCTAKAATHQVAEAERLWAFINTTRARLAAMSDDEDGDLDHPLWDALGAAETKLCAIVAPSPRVAEMQLWIGLDHKHVNDRAADLAISHRDLAGLVARKAPLDFDEKMLVSALQSLRAAQEA